LKGLQLVWLQGTIVTEKGIKELQRAVPEVEFGVE
jgi:hypothetical protein